jgi:CRP/FNR family nitrogen fixation transcriptional regulator
LYLAAVPWTQGKERSMHVLPATTIPSMPPIGAMGARTLAKRISESPTAELGLARRLRKDEELFAEGEPAAFFCKVVSGAVRTYKLLDDGRRQIGAFHLPGDIFGLELGTKYRFSAEATTEASVVLYRRCAFEAMTTRDSEFSRQVMSATMRALARAQDHMLLLGRKSALEKMSTFLLDMAKRLSDDNAQIELPMSRIDIADYLGVTIETVSRSFTALERDGVIDLPVRRRTILLRDKRALQRLSATAPTEPTHVR